MDRATTAKIIAPLMCAYPNAKITSETVQVYATALADQQQNVLQAAVLKCMKNYKFLPSISEIIDECNNLTALATGTQVKAPDEAWAEVTRQMNEAFIYKKPVFSTPEIEQAALAMGWTGMCETETDQIGTVRAQFLKMYESVCKRKREAKANEAILQLLGDVVKQIGK